MDYIINAILGIVCSIVAAWIFWFFSFKKTNVNIRFPDKIEKSPNSFDSKGYRYRVKLINVGNENIIEVSFFAKLYIKREKIKNSCYLSFGHRGFMPILYGKKWQNKKENKNTGFSWTIEFGMADETYSEFSKKFYPENIREKAVAHTLTLDDIFNTFKDSFQISIYAFGYDSVTGARKMFVSKRYTSNDILEGTYIRSSTIDKYEDYINNILSIDLSKTAPNLSIKERNKTDKECS